MKGVYNVRIWLGKIEKKNVLTNDENGVIYYNGVEHEAYFEFNLGNNLHNLKLKKYSGKTLS